MPTFATDPPLEVGAIITGLGGGLALFLFGMRRMTDALQAVAGSGMKTLLAKMTANPFTAMLAGVIVTAVIQSSSVTTVLVVGFISAGLMNSRQSIGVIIGANVGTTMTGQIIAFQVYKYGLVMIAVGFLTEIFAKRQDLRQWGIAVMGLGLVFFGMELMTSATGPLRTWQPFHDFLSQMRNPLVGILVGVVFTAAVQNSSATTGIVIVLAGQGLISLEAGIGLIFGSNIGTCVTVVLSSFGRPREAVQAAVIHVVFNVLGVLLWVLFIPQFAELVRYLSPVASDLDESARLAAEVPRQVANAHTVFNVTNALVFIWFVGPLAKLADRLVPERPVPEGLRPLYLEEIFLDQPAMALDQVRREMVRLAELVQQMLAHVLQVVAHGSQEELKQFSDRDDEVDDLHGAIVTYLGRLSLKTLVEPQPEQVYQFLEIANYLENIGDIMETDLLDDARKRLKVGVPISAATMTMLEPIHEKVSWAFGRAIEALRSGDQEAAREAANSKAAVNRLAELASSHLAKRLVASEPHRLTAFQMETEIIENLKRLNTLTRRIARLLLVIEEEKPEGANEPQLSDANPASYS